MIKFLTQLVPHLMWQFASLMKGLLCIGALLFGLQVMTSPALATGVYQMPVVSAGDRTWVIDEADVISRLNEGKISDSLQKLADATGNEVRFATVHRLDYGETPETFATQLFQTWYPEADTQSNQTLLVLDDVTNGVAIKVGADSTAVLTEDIAQSVAQETVMVPLREGSKYNEAFLQATDRLVAVLSGEPDPGPPQLTENFEIEGTFATAEETEEHRTSATTIVVVFLVLATIIPMATYYLYQMMGG